MGSETELRQETFDPALVAALRLTLVPGVGPLTRKALLEHPLYYEYRDQVLAFLEEYEHGATSKKKNAA